MTEEDDEEEKSYSDLRWQTSKCVFMFVLEARRPFSNLSQNLYVCMRTNVCEDFRDIAIQNVYFHSEQHKILSFKRMISSTIWGCR